MIEGILLALLLLAAAVFLLILLVQGLIGLLHKAKKKPNAKLAARAKRTAVFLCGTLVVMYGLIAFSQLLARTPEIVSESGSAAKGSIAELRRVELNGRKEYISIRGQNAQNPVLLFLAGGPGGSQMAAVRYDLAALEKDFVVVNWDQPGAGKSYYAAPIKGLTVDTYIEDGYALTEYLCDTFKREKIYLVGESWGSALGIFLASRYPKRYHAFVGTGQMVDFVETEILDYNKAMALAQEKGSAKVVEALKSNGAPPYYGSDVTWKSAEYLNFLSAAMSRNPEIQNAGFNTLRDLFAPEYGILDKINYLRGVIDTFNHVYPQLYGTDLRAHYKDIAVPVYFFIGRHDINAPTALAEDYYNVLNAPVKRLVWFEHSGHNPWINESGRFVQELLKVKAETVE